MNQLTDREKQLAVTHCLDVLALAITNAQGEGEDDNRKTTGVLIINFKEDGDYNTYQGGILNKGLTLGALVDTIISYREQALARQAGEFVEALLTSASIPDDELN